MRGVITTVKRISEMESAHKKRYMGVWSLRSDQTAAMMTRFPRSVKRYISRYNRKRAGSICRGKAEKPKRINSDTVLEFR